MIQPFLAVALSLAGVFLLWAGFTFNALVRAGLQVDEAWSTVAVQLKRRASLVPGLVETVKGYAAHERETLEAVAAARAGLEAAGAPAEVQAANTALTAALGRLFAVAEAYPELKASAGFTDLQTRLAELEDKIAYARQFYNRAALDYNARIATVPSSLIANAFGAKPRPFFDIDEASAQTPKVSFAPAPKAA